VDIGGPYFNKSAGRWELRWTDPDGKARCFSRKDRALVDARAAELLAVPSATPPGSGVSLGPLRPFDGTGEWVREALGQALDASLQATRKGDSRALTALRKHIANLKDALATWVPYSGFLELEAAHEQILDYLENHGHLVEREGATGLQPCNPALAEALNRGTDPWAELKTNEDAN